MKADILEEVILDCDRMSDEAAARPDLADFKPKLSKGSMSASQHALGHAIAKALHLRRLAWAEAEDVPMGRMLSNAALHAMAQRPPSTLKELSRLEGVRGAFAREHGEEVLAVIRELIARSRAGELAPLEEAKGEKDPQRRKRDEALRQWRGAKAQERKVTPSVVLPNALIEDLSRAPPQTLEELAENPVPRDQAPRALRAGAAAAAGEVIPVTETAEAQPSGRPL